MVTPPRSTRPSRSLVASGRRAWPAIAIAPETFVRHLAHHADAEALADVHGDDLYLAAACLAGDAAAIAAFDAELLSRVPAIVRRIAKTPAAVDEARPARSRRGPHRVRGRAAARPVLGPRAAARLGTHRRAQQRADGGAPAARDRPPEPRPRPTRARRDQRASRPSLAKQRHGPQFQQALDGAIATLTPRERNLVRAYYVDEMSVDRLGVRFRVHRATAARWLQTAREKLLDETRRRLGELVDVTPSEFQSLALAIKSQLSISFGG